MYIRKPNFPVFASADREITAAIVAEKISKISLSFDEFKARHEASQADQEKQLRELSAKIAAGRTVGSVLDAGISAQDRTEFQSFCRAGVRAAMTTDSNPDGGYLVPTTIDSNIAVIARNISPMRRISQVVTASGVYKKLVSLNGTTANWRGERSSVPETDGQAFAEIQAPEGELTASPRVSNWLLDDSQFDVANTLSVEIAQLFAQKEGAAFVNGDGIDKPRGFLTVPVIAQASWAWGSLGFLKTGDANGFIAATTSASPADILKDLMFSLKVDYRQNATWVMSSATAGVVSKFKDGEGRFIWQDSLVAGQPALLLGRPVEILEDMPSVAASNFPVAFGDFSRGYLVVDRPGLRLLRDPYSAKPYVIFDTMKRVGGVVLDYDAIKLLKVSA